MDLLEAAEGRTVIIYGAHLIALELFRYLADGMEDLNFAGFAVTSLDGNPDTVEGYSVRCIQEYTPEDEAVVFIAMPQKYHFDVAEYAKSKGFYNIYPVSQEMMEEVKGRWIIEHVDKDLLCEICKNKYDRSWLDIFPLSQNEEERYRFKLPTLYFENWNYVEEKIRNTDMAGDFRNSYGVYRDIENLQRCMDEKDIDISEYFRIFMVFSCWDNGNRNEQKPAPWIVPIQAGSILTDNKADTLLDETGDSISEMNRGLAELTAAYWIWKNRNNTAYKGLCHYRRHFVLDKKDLEKVKGNDIDAILTIPRFAPGGVGKMFLAETPVKQHVLDTMINSIGDLYLKEKSGFCRFLEGDFYHPNNMVIAKNEIYNSYCEWMFPVIFRMKEMDEVLGYGHESDRHLAYAAELLTSYYFNSRNKRYKVCFTDYEFI